FGFLSLNLGRGGLGSRGWGLRFLHEFLVRSMNSLLACIQFLDKLLGRLVAIFRSFPHLLGRFVSAAGAKANGGSDFVAGFAFGPYGNISGGFDGLAGQHPPPRPLPLNGLQFLGLCHLLREGLLPLPVKLNDRLSLVKDVSIADDLHRDGFHPKGQSRLPTSVAADDGAVILDGERHHYPMPPNTLNEILRQNLIPVDFAVERMRLQLCNTPLQFSPPSVRCSSVSAYRKAGSHGGNCQPLTPAAEAGKLEPNIHFLFSPKGDWAKSTPCNPPTSTGAPCRQ